MILRGEALEVRNVDGVLHIARQETVLERLGATESTTLAIKREDGGKIRVTSLLYLVELAAVPVSGTFIIKPPAEHDHRDPTYKGGK